MKLPGVALTVGVVLVLAALIVVVTLPDTIPAVLTSSRATHSPVAAATPSPSPGASPSTSPSPSPPDRTAALQALTSDLTKLAAGARFSVSLVELSGTAPLVLWSIKPDTSWTADSQYKLALLMAEAQGIGSGKLKATDKLCYKATDYEAGWYQDYFAGNCYTRAFLAQRVGHYSDNTAARILLRYLGGATALNTFAKSMGATQSKFFTPNTTTSADLARMWAAETTATGGGAGARSWLYPLFTKTYSETGIPKGTPKAPVVHQSSYSRGNFSDAALVVNGPKGAYVLTIWANGPAYTAGWAIISKMATRVWQFEVARPA